jgi:hypothetical protein
MQRKIAIVTILIAFVAALCIILRTPHSETPTTATPERKDQPQVRRAPVEKTVTSFPNTAPPVQPPLTLGQRLARMGTPESQENHLTEAEIANYLAQNHTNALSLLTAFQASGDREFLRQAAANFPDDPLVQARVLVHNLYPDQRQQWLDALKKSAPENSLPNFLAARDYMDQGNATAALAEITSTANKHFDDYYRHSALGLEEAYLGAGRSPAEAKALGGSEILLPQLAPLKSLGVQLADLSAEYGKAGDSASQQALLNGVYEMATQLRDNGNQGTLVTSLVGLALQNIVLQHWPEGIPADVIQSSIADQLAANQQYRQSIKADTHLLSQWLPSASESEIIAYLDHRQSLGEENALKWLKSRHFLPITSTIRLPRLK